MKHILRIFISLTVIISLLSSVSTAGFASQADKKEAQQSGETGSDLFRDSAEETTNNVLKDQMTGGELIWSIVKIVFALALIIVLIYVLIRFLSRKSGNFDSPRKLRIVAGIGLSPQKSMQIVEVGAKIYIIGVGQDIRVLDKIEHPDEIEALLQSLQTPLMDNQLILSWKDKITNLFKKKEITSEEIELDMEEYEKLFSEQLKDATNRQNTVDNWMDENKERTEQS